MINNEVKYEDWWYEIWRIGKNRNMHSNEMNIEMKMNVNEYEYEKDVKNDD
jgi:hypothetical protein